MDNHEKHYKKASIFKPLRHLKYLFKKPLSHPMETIFTKKNANVIAQDRFIRPKWADTSEPREAPKNLRGFHVNDWDKCIGCGSCAEICPTDAITMVERTDIEVKPGQHQQRPTIDYGRCCFCALCVDVCTTESLSMTKEYIYTSADANDFYLMPEKLFQDHEVKLGYEKSPTTDLLDLERVEMDHIEPGKRIKSYIEVVRGYSKELAKKEASRCLGCNVCSASCPVQMDISSYIKAIWEDDIEGGLRLMYETNPLPGVCGRVCTHNCETSCAVGIRGEAVAIRWLKRYIIDNSPDDMYEDAFGAPVSKVIDGKIAIAGSGPASLSAAYYLRGLGYTVDVFEEKNIPGGVMSYGAPQYRIPDYAVKKDLDFIKKTGVNIHINTRVGKDISFEKLHKDYDAVFLGTGFFRARKLNIPGSDHPEIMGAMDFLPLTRDYARGDLKLEDMNVKPSAVVIGGGDVAFDVARNMVRLQIAKYGKADVKLTSLESLDILPASDDEYIEGKEEGIKFYLGNGPQEIVINKDGTIAGVRVHKCLRVFDENGRFSPEFDPKQEQIIKGEQVFFSIGQAPDYEYLPESIKSKMTIERGKIKADENGKIDGLDWLYVGGDVFRGPDIISAVADGHRAAVAIDAQLFSKAQKKELDEHIKEIREDIKFNKPLLPIKPARKRTLK